MMLDGEKTVGWITADNYSSGRPMTNSDVEILKLYSSTLGHLTSRKRAEEAAFHFQLNLKALNEVGIELRKRKRGMIYVARRLKLGAHSWVLTALASGFSMMIPNMHWEHSERMRLDKHATNVESACPFLQWANLSWKPSRLR